MITHFIEKAETSLSPLNLGQYLPEGSTVTFPPPERFPPSQWTDTATLELLAREGHVEVVVKDGSMDVLKPGGKDVYVKKGHSATLTNGDMFRIPYFGTYRLMVYGKPRDEVTASANSE